MVDFLLLSISILPEVTQVYIQSTPVLTVKSKPVKAEINPGNKFINQINKVILKILTTNYRILD